MLNKGPSGLHTFASYFTLLHSSRGALVAAQLQVQLQEQAPGVGVGGGEAVFAGAQPRAGLQGPRMMAFQLWILTLLLTRPRITSTEEHN